MMVPTKENADANIQGVSSKMRSPGMAATMTDDPCFDAIATEGVQDFDENDVFAPSDPPCTKDVHQDGSFAFALSCHGHF
jgi:hypothetical protein